LAPALRVLIVDDEMLIRWALGQALGAQGCPVTEAGNAREALSALRTGDFDVVVMDYRLPDTTHLDLLREVRRLSPSSHVVMMTAFGTTEMIDEAIDLGVSRVLEKPIDLHVATQAILNV
jgi:DNA-binding NtrC family response regulator